MSELEGAEQIWPSPAQAHDISQQIITELPGISMSTVNFSLMKNVVLTAPGAGISLPTEEVQAMEQHWKIHLCSGWDPIEAWGLQSTLCVPLCSPITPPVSSPGSDGMFAKNQHPPTAGESLWWYRQLQMQIWGDEGWFHLGTGISIPFPGMGPRALLQVQDQRDQLGAAPAPC